MMLTTLHILATEDFVMMLDMGRHTDAARGRRRSRMKIRAGRGLDRAH